MAWRMGFMGGLPSTLINQAVSHQTTSAAPPQDASDHSQELLSHGTYHSAAAVRLSRMSLLRIGRPGQQLGARRRRVYGLGIPGNVLCTPMGK
jgi:hypothetical protein